MKKTNLPTGNFDHLPDPTKTKGPSAGDLRNGYTGSDSGFAQKGNDINNTVRPGSTYKEKA